MAYGEYDGPDKPDKGVENGSCNVTSCQDSPAIWYNHGSLRWYCVGCRNMLEFDPFNKKHWDTMYLLTLGHPMFETREMMNTRIGT